MTTVLPLVLSNIRIENPSFCLNFQQSNEESLDNIRAMSVPSWTSCRTYKGCKSGYLDFEGKRLEPRKGQDRFHFVSYVMYLSGATFEDYRSNIYPWFSILPFKLHSLLRHHFPNLHDTKTLISLKQIQMCQKGKSHSAVFLKAFK